MRRSIGQPAKILLLTVLFPVLVQGCGPGEEGPPPEPSEIREGPGASSGGPDTAPERPAPEAPAGDDQLPGPQAEPGPVVGSPTSTEVPEGGLGTWVVEMRDRLEDVELDPRASHDQVLELYLTWHAAVERYYGAGGRFTGQDHPELARAVAAQDTAFQGLMELTGTTDYIERTHLLHAIRNVRLALEGVLAEAREADVPLER